MKTFFTYLKGDRVIWMITILLGLLSLISVYSFTNILTLQHKNVSTEDYLFKHVVMLVTGNLRRGRGRLGASSSVRQHSAH